jgi:hypothetical protein
MSLIMMGLADEFITDDQPRKFSIPTSEKHPGMGAISCGKFSPLAGDASFSMSFDPLTESSI